MSVTSQMIGLRTRSKKPIGRATIKANRSAKLKASVLGASSPTMIEASAMSSVVSRNAMVEAASRTNCSGINRISSAMDPEHETAPTFASRGTRLARTHRCSMTAPQLYGACRHAHHRLPGGNVARHDSPGAGLGSGSDGDGCAEGGVDPDEGARADHSCVLVDAVEV